MKNLLTYSGIIIFLIGFFIGWGKFQGLAEQTAKTVEEVKKDTKEKVEKVEDEVEKTKDKVTEEREVNIEQTATLKYIQQTLEKLNSKIDKELETPPATERTP